MAVIEHHTVGLVHFQEGVSREDVDIPALICPGCHISQRESEGVDV